MNGGLMAMGFKPKLSFSDNIPSGAINPPYANGIEKQNADRFRSALRNPQSSIEN
jgi:hypothetical protein